jgi:hypothetical protein
MSYCDKHPKSSYGKEFAEIESYAIVMKLSNRKIITNRGAKS